MNKEEIRAKLFELNIPALRRLMNNAVAKGLTTPSMNIFPRPRISLGKELKKIWKFGETNRGI